jgi:hypothetical protein
MYRMDGFYGSGLGNLARIGEWKDQLTTIAPTAIGGVAGAAAAHYLTTKAFEVIRGDASVAADSYRAKAAPYVALATPFIGAVVTRTMVPAEPGTRKKQIRDAAAAGMAIYGTAALIAYFIPADTKSEMLQKVRGALPFTAANIGGFGAGGPPPRWPAGTPNLRARSPIPAYGSIAPTQTRVLPAGMGSISPQTASVRRVSMSGFSSGPSF